MANEHIGRKRSWGIGAEDTADPGTSVAAEIWIRRDTGDITPDITTDEDDSAMGVIDAISDISVAKDRSLIPIGGRVRDNSIGYILHALMGTETLVQCCTITGQASGTPARGDAVSSATGSYTGTIKKLILIGTTTYYFISEDTGSLDNETDLTDGTWTGGTVDFTTFAAVKGHFFSRLNTNNHPSFTLYTSDDVSDVKATYCLLDTFDFEVIISGAATFTANFIGKKLETPSAQSPTFGAENVLLAKHADVKFAANEAALGAASASSLQRFKLSVTKDVMDVQKFNTTDVESLHNQSFRVTGDLEAIYNAETYRDYVANGTKKACRASLINDEATVIYDASGDDIYPSLYFDLMENHFTEWTRSEDNNSLINQTMGFTGGFKRTDAATLEILLLNTTAAAYAHA